jgi:hypothetical protein
MSTKKKTTTKTTTKRTTLWNEYFKAAITGLASNTTTDDLMEDAEQVHTAADIVRTAERIADIATARNS